MSWRDMNVDACHIRAAERQLPAQQLDRLDAGMGKIAGGVIFEERLHDKAAGTRQWPTDRQIPVALSRDEALRHLEHTRIGRESARRKACSQHAVGRGATSMERFR